MIGILASTFRIATRIQGHDKPAGLKKDGFATPEHERRKRDELRLLRQNDRRYTRQPDAFWWWPR